VLPYELLRDDPAAFTAELERRLDLPLFPPAPRPLNPSLSPEGLRWYPRLTRLIDRLPVGAPLRKALLRFYVPRIGGRRLEALVRLLQRARPATPVTPDLITDEMLGSCRGKAERLRGNPYYSPYRQEYFL
jgi:DNA-binding transcriptional LysR family regulator